MTASMRIPMVVGSEKVILNVGVLVELVLKSTGVVGVGLRRMID